MAPLPPTLLPRSLCESPTANRLRYRTSLNHAHVFSAGFAGGFIDREVESKGVCIKDLVAISFLIYTLVARLHRQAEGEAPRSVLLVTPTICANQFYSQGEGGASLGPEQRLLGVDVDAGHGCSHARSIDEVTKNACTKCIQPQTLSARVCESAKGK